ncbi:hypothetical protein J6590_000970 [Homalodisca vitripennis]|nr:hypothetical protein J6590_000970 [Homalodisca vitripennis]
MSYNVPDFCLDIFGIIEIRKKSGRIVKKLYKSTTQAVRRGAAWSGVGGQGRDDWTLQTAMFACMTPPLYRVVLQNLPNPFFALLTVPIYYLVLFALVTIAWTLYTPIVRYNCLLLNTVGYRMLAVTAPQTGRRGTRQIAIFLSKLKGLQNNSRNGRLWPERRSGQEVKKLEKKTISKPSDYGLLAHPSSNASGFPWFYDVCKERSDAKMKISGGHLVAVHLAV